jgi:hypothetical protein
MSGQTALGFHAAAQEWRAPTTQHNKGTNDCMQITALHCTGRGAGLGWVDPGGHYRHRPPHTYLARALSAWQCQPKGPCKARPLEPFTMTPAPSGSFEGSLGLRAPVGCRHVVEAVSFV